MSRSKDTTVPFLRWAGGKRWAAKSLASVIRLRLDDDSVYIEPFLGSGAVFFAVAPRRAILSDINEELIIAFGQVKENPRKLKEKLVKMPATKEYYDRLRKARPDSPFERASRLIYLNRNGYGGIYRENLRGEYNVPYSGDRSHAHLCANGLLDAASAVLEGASLRCVDFESAIEMAGDRDVVYCDPTYLAPRQETFNRYSRHRFGWHDQERLSDAVTRAYTRGSLVFVSNSYNETIERLYPDAVNFVVRRAKGLGGSAKTSSTREYLFMLDPEHDPRFQAMVRDTLLRNGRLEST